LKRSRLVALLWVAAILVFGGCGGGNAVPFNATPSVSDLFPSVITAGSDGFVMAVTGTGFISGAKGVTFINWNGSPRSTSFNQDTGQLSVQIFASDVLTPNQIIVTATNPGPGGGTSLSDQIFTIEPAHAGLTLTSFDPTSANVGSGAFTLTATGTGFGPGDVITWNGTQLVTTVAANQSTQASAQITADLLTTAGTASVSVATADPTVATKSQTFAISGQNNPTPDVSSLSPSSTAHGGVDFEMRVQGSGFVPTSYVEFNGAFCATAYVSNSQLVAYVQAANIATAGNATVQVINPAPGGGTSSQQMFTIN
jgi:trimeric autotransporter adhesin